MNVQNMLSTRRHSPRSVPRRHRVVILGAGYAGVAAARRLARQVRPHDVEITLISAFADFVERPRLHQIAVGQPITQLPLEGLLARSGVRIRVASVVGIDLEQRTVQTVESRSGRERAVGYDTLVYGLGSNIDVTTTRGVAEHCVTLVGFGSAMKAHTRLGELKPGATVTVVGGGPTGLEVAGEVAESYPQARTRLVSDRPPGNWLAPKAKRYLGGVFDQLGVEVVDGVRVAAVTDGHLVDSDNGREPFDLCIWAGGFTVPELARTAGLAVNRADRAVVDQMLESVSHPGVYVIGDAAAVAGSWGEQLAMGCRSGGFTGPRVADTIAARLTGRDPKPFTFRYFHECISLGRRHGIIQFLNGDETPKNRILTGRKAVWYKNAVLNGSRVALRNPGPYLAPRRRPVVPTAAER